MNSISTEQANIEWAKFATKFEEVGLAEHYDMDKLKDEILASPCTTNEESGNAYAGALLIHINMVMGIAQRIAKMISGTFQIDENSLIKVCMLMHLGKRFMFEPTDSEWEAKRGYPFRFKNSEYALKSSDLSIIEAGNNGVHLLPEEYEGSLLGKVSATILTIEVLTSSAVAAIAVLDTNPLRAEIPLPTTLFSLFTSTLVSIHSGFESMYQVSPLLEDMMESELVYNSMDLLPPFNLNSTRLLLVLRVTSFPLCETNKVSAEPSYVTIKL